MRRPEGTPLEQRYPKKVVDNYPRAVHDVEMELTTETAGALVSKFIAAWNNGDPDGRSATINDLVAKDVYYANPNEEFVGLERVISAVGEAYETFVAPGGTFSAGEVRAHHDGMTFRWSLISSDAENPAVTGQMAVVVNEDGRFNRFYQFPDSTPTRTQPIG